MKRRVVVPLAALLLASAGCKLSEQVTAPPGESTVIAHMVLNTAAPMQTLLLERSDGGTSRSPLSGATVRLTHLSPNTSCARPTVTLTEGVDSSFYWNEGEVRRVYQTRDLCTLHAGDRIGLRVETAQGEVVTGTTQIPGADRTLVRAGAVTGVPSRVLPLDRTRDSLHVEVDPRFARALLIEVVRKGESNPMFSIATDTMHATIPGNLLDPFDDDDDRTTFRAGADYLFSFATTDANYFDFVRSGANPFTGRGFINHLSGGIGVFGSVAPQTYEVRVTAPQRDPREGVYRIFGPLANLGGKSIDVRWNVYLDAASESANFSAFMDGSWVEGPVSKSVDGTFNGGFHARFHGMPPDPRATPPAYYELHYNGTLPPRGTSFTAVLSAWVGGQRTTDRVSVVQISGP